LPARAEIRVEFDGAAFLQHRRSGISRYFAELAAAYDADPALGVAVSMPYRYVTNLHVAATGRRLRSLPLPRRMRGPVLEALNAPARRRASVPDIVHAPLYDPAVLERAGDARVVTTVYDFTFEVLPELFGDVSRSLADKRTFLERADALVCISQATADDLKALHPEVSAPVVVAPLAVSEEFFHAAPTPVPGMPARYLLHVGNREVHKNTGLVLRAFAELARVRPDLHLVMSGAGVPGEAERIAELGITDRTHLVKVSDAHLPSLYRNAAAFVFPSRYEGFGLPVLEAMAAGCPVVVSSTPALVEVVDDAAEVVDPDDLDGLVQVLGRILDDPAVGSALARAGVSRARDFSWRRTAELTRIAYDEAMAR